MTQQIQDIINTINANIDTAASEGTQSAAVGFAHSGVNQLTNEFETMLASKDSDIIAIQGQANGLQDQLTTANSALAALQQRFDNFKQAIQEDLSAA